MTQYLSQQVINRHFLKFLWLKKIRDSKNKKTAPLKDGEEYDDENDLSMQDSFDPEIASLMVKEDKLMDLVLKKLDFRENNIATNLNLSHYLNFSI